MNENLGATRMANSVADELHGTMGSRVKPGEWFGGSKGYRFPYYNWNTHDPSRLVLVDDSAKLDPDSGSSRVTVRFRTGAVGSNIVQKGQNGTYTNAAGATIYHQFFKIDLEQGVPVCMFQSAHARSSIKWGTAVNDTKWHTVVCERIAGSAVAISVDGGTPRRTNRDPGAIANDKKLSIGGKYECRGKDNDPKWDNVGCDYFVGAIDRISIEKF